MKLNFRDILSDKIAITILIGSAVFSSLIIGAAVYASHFELWDREKHYLDAEKNGTPLQFYNSARKEYLNDNFSQASTYWENVLDQGSALPSKLTAFSLFNLANSLYHETADSTTDFSTQKDKLDRALLLYRDLIHGPFPLSRSNHQIIDLAKINYEITLQQRNWIISQMKEQSAKKHREKDSYILLKEILKEEEKILSQLEALESIKDEDKQQEQRFELITAQETNREKLEILRKKLNLPPVNVPKPQTYITI